MNHDELKSDTIYDLIRYCIDDVMIVDVDGDFLRVLIRKSYNGVVNSLSLYSIFSDDFFDHESEVAKAKPGEYMGFVVTGKYAKVLIKNLICFKKITSDNCTEQYIEQLLKIYSL